MAQNYVVHGMTCDGCEAAVEDALSDLPGVVSVDADSDADVVTIEGAAERDEVAAAVEAAGYEM